MSRVVLRSWEQPWPSIRAAPTTRESSRASSSRWRAAEWSVTNSSTDERAVSSTRVATIGELVLDQVVVEDRHSTHSQLGGGAIYSAVGAGVWGAQAEVFAVAGSDVGEVDLDHLADAGIGVGSLTRIDGASLGLWLLYERSGRRQ